MWLKVKLRIRRNYEFLVVFITMLYMLTLKLFRVRIYTGKDIPKLANIKKKEAYDVYIGRANYHLNLPTSIWYNPFPVDENGKHIFFRESMREQVIADHMEYLKNNKKLLKELKSLSRKTLGCYCTTYEVAKNNKITKKCHGHNIIQMYITHVLKLDFNIFEQ